MRPLDRKGQGSFISGDIPSIIMIVLSIGFFLSSIYLANGEFQSKKEKLDMEAAVVDAASVFLKENSKLRSDDLESTSEFWAEKLTKISRSYSVNVYVELSCTKMTSTPPCHTTYTNGDPPSEQTDTITKMFPIALIGDTELDVYPAVIKLYVYRGKFK